MSVSSFDQLVTSRAVKSPRAPALLHKNELLNYDELASQVNSAAKGLLENGLSCQQRVAIYLPKQFEAVISLFAVCLAGGAFVPVNPLLKSQQVAYIIDNCQASVFVTSFSRYKQLKTLLKSCQSIQTIILTGCKAELCPVDCLRWEDFIAQGLTSHLPTAKNDPTKMAAILYTSGSTGQPKGVVLSHINLVEGAKSVAQYLNNNESDRLLAVLPFSFDYGLSQLTTAFLCGASVVLMEYLLPRDVIAAVSRFQITGLAAVPPLWMQLSELEWPQQAIDRLRYFTNSGGAMPSSTLQKLRQALPNSEPFLMYGLTEAFRSSYLDPKEIDCRANSIGKAIPNAELFVLNPQGELCEPEEAGELVHKGIHVALGYWQNAVKTKEKFRPLPKALQQKYGKEIAVWSGDSVKLDIDGFLYFIGRNDDMIKSSGYRISPAELENVIQDQPQVKEVAAIGIAHVRLGQAILLVITPTATSLFDEKELLKYCKNKLPNFMQPQFIELSDSLPRNPNGKINRPLLSERYQDLASKTLKARAQVPRKK